MWNPASGNGRFNLRGLSDFKWLWLRLIETIVSFEAAGWLWRAGGNLVRVLWEKVSVWASVSESWFGS